MSCQRMKMEVHTWVDDWTGETLSDGKMVPECSFYDTSLHSYACSVCSQKFWYSERGRIAEERGVSVLDVPSPADIPRVQEK